MMHYICIKHLNYCKFTKVYLTKTPKQSICQSFTLPEFCATDIANRSRWKSFAVTLQFTGKHSRLDGSLVWPKPIAQAISLKVSRLPIDPRNFSTSNNLQYTVYGSHISKLGARVYV